MIGSARAQNKLQSPRVAVIALLLMVITDCKFGHCEVASSSALARQLSMPGRMPARRLSFQYDSTVRAMLMNAS